MKKSKPKVYNPPLLPIFSFLSSIYFIYYIWWRATATLNPDLPFFSWVLWSAEAFGLVSYFLFSWITRNIAPKIPYTKPAKGLKVDIFIPTYDEDLDIIEATLVGCQKIQYAHTTYVLDDGNRAEVKKLAQNQECVYITRPTHENAKAGNINYALQQTDGEFIVVLDADMVPQPNYLERTLGYFKDKKLALVQLPQEFYNWDSIQHGSKGTYWHEQSLFFRVIQPGKNYSDSAFWCGSPSVIRRSALLEVGGVATETITEDIHTTVRLHSRGWKTMFVNEPLAFGIAPQTIKAFLLQRLRWAQGTMQLYRSKDSPLWVRGLTMKQRLSYLSSFLAYFEAFQKLILLLTPILILSFDIFPMDVDLIPFMLRWVPYFILNIFANQLEGRGVFNYFKTEKYNLLKTIIFIQSTFTLFGKKSLTFRVTPKTTDSSVYRHERISIRWYMGILGVIVAAMIYAVVRIFLPHAQTFTWDAFVIAFVWAGYNSYVIFLAIREILTKRHERKQYRFQINAAGEIINTSSGQAENVHIIDLSITGAGLLIDQELNIKADNQELMVNPEGFEAFKISIEKIYKRCCHPSGKDFVGINFKKDLGPQRDELFEFLFVHLPRSEENILYRVNDWDPFRIFRKAK
ncbi:MAG TPA: glycosyltransferase [Anaerolineae bacterium]|nr:glycosyltransferase [Anaerolineae bacterium]